MILRAQPIPHLSRQTVNSSMKPKNIFDKDVNLDSMYYLRKTFEILKIKKLFCVILYRFGSARIDCR